MDCCTELLYKALIRSLSRINKDGGIQQPSLEAGVPHSRQTDKTSSYYLICLFMQIIHQEKSSELRRSLTLAALADVVALEEVKEELRHDTGTAESGAKVDRCELRERASSQKWVSREVQLPGTFLHVRQAACPSAQARLHPPGNCHRC